METYNELNVAASDLHESDPEEVWSNDLGWVPKSDLQAAREKEVTKLREFDTFEEVLQDEAEGDIISSRFVDKWDTSGELRSRLVSRGYEVSEIDPASLLLQHRRSLQRELHWWLGLAHDLGCGSGGHFWSFSSCSCGTTVLRETASRLPKTWNGVESEEILVR